MGMRYLAIQPSIVRMSCLNEFFRALSGSDTKVWCCGVALTALARQYHVSKPTETSSNRHR